MESKRADSVRAAAFDPDTAAAGSAEDSLARDTTTLDTASYHQSTINNDDSNTPSERISKKIAFLKPVLVPQDSTYTGVALVIDAFPFLPFFGVFFSFVFLLISFLIKFFEAGAVRTIALLNILALGLLLIAEPYSWNADKLWGLWMTVSFVFILAVYDLYRLTGREKARQRHPDRVS